MPEASGGRTSGPGARVMLRTGVVLETVLAGLADRGPAEVVDLGGGTGGLAVQLAIRGHRVTVVDPSPDSLAALDRRTAESGTSALVRGVQGDAAAIGELVTAGSVDLVLCHSVLEVVDDPVEALRSAGRLLRPGGAVSVLVANRVAAVLARAGAGRLAEARRVLADADGRDGPHDPLSRRFTVSELQQLVTAAGLVPAGLTGVRLFADLVPSAVLDDPAVIDDLLALERTVSADPAYLTVATQLLAWCVPPAAV